MIIRKVAVKRFKRFADETFELPGHVVFAGPNNIGKTTVLQAVAAFSLALEKWRLLNDFHRHGGAYTHAPIVRQVFSAVPLRNFDLLWHSKKPKDGPVEITISPAHARPITFEFKPSSSEQIWVRPALDVDPEVLKTLPLRAVFAPAMSGLSIEEPVYQRAKIEQLLGFGKPGDVLRNLLVEAAQSENWAEMVESIERLFTYRLVPPNAEGPDILAEYEDSRGVRYDIASAGTGFLQVLMLLTFLHVRPGSVLLVDEPDAHLHMILQDAIYGELRRIAAKNDCQLIIATHSEVIINSVDPDELCVMLDKPRLLSTVVEKAKIVDALGILSATDIVEALELRGVLYVEGFTDMQILQEFARKLRHPALTTLETLVFWRSNRVQHRDGANGIAARDHHEALTLVRAGIPGLELVDGDAESGKTSTPITGKDFQRLRWKRYEIESYLVHPDALARFVEKQVGSGDAAAHVADLQKYLQENLPPAVLKDPLGDHDYLKATKARTSILPPALHAAGVGVPYQDYYQIAQVMKPEEIHFEVKEKLDLLQQAFGL